jgi:hypothetical protein
MASFEFLCPHCSGRFELENPPPGEQTACPLCGGPLAIPPELPEPPPAPPQVQPASAPAEVDVTQFGLNVDPSPARAPGVVSREEPLSREEKERRRQVRSLIWMIGGVLLLAVAAIVLSRL